MRGFSNNLKISQPLETDKSRSTDNKISLKVLSGKVVYTIFYTEHQKPR